MGSWYVVRHGETLWNRSGRVQGHTDVPLSEHGRLQARVGETACRTQVFRGLRQ